MPWNLIIAPRAERDLARLPAYTRAAVDRALSGLAADPQSVDLAKLRGRRQQWRLRVGQWRAILRLETATGRVYVLRVLPRSRAYRG